MKLFFFFALLFCVQNTFSQDMIYLTDGHKIPGKISEITADKINFKNLANPSGPIYTQSISNVQLAFNTSGDFLIFSSANPLTDKEKQDFLAATPKQRPYDIFIDPTGKILNVTITDETEDEIAADNAGQKVKFLKTNLSVLIRKNGKHKIYASPEFAVPLLAAGKSKIAEILAMPVPAPIAADNNGSDYLEPDMTAFSAKSIAKTQEFTGYLQSIESVNTNRDDATKSIGLACDLFLNQGVASRVEVSNTANAEVHKYLIHDYLNRLMIKSGQFEKVNIEFANINYASKFKKGADGNYYGTVTFVQKFQGFVDGNLVLAEEHKQSLTIVLKHYDKIVNGDKVSAWDIFLDDMGVVENKKV
jgi:hypothetical protein